MKDTPQFRNPDTNPASGQAFSQAVPAEAVRVQLRRILAHESFAHSERLRRFLGYTVEQALKGESASLKEYQVGLEVFDRSESYDPRIDPIVRVEAVRLRAKLKDFYSSEGCSAPVIIEFPKGSYVPVFRARTAAEVKNALRRASSSPSKALSSAAVLLLGLLLIWAGFLYRDNLSLQRQVEAAPWQVMDTELAAFWEHYFAPGARNFVVFGSPVFVASERDNYFLRWGGLNESNASSMDPRFNTMQRRFGPLSGPRYDYALMGDAIALHRVTAFFGRSGGNLTAVASHLATWESIKSGNIIFLGAPRMIPLLARLPVEQDFEWDAEHNVVNRNPQPGEADRYVTSSHYDEATFAVIASHPGLRAGCRVLLLTAHSAPGTLAAVEYVTQPETVRALIQRLGSGEGAAQRHFQMLLRVIVDTGNPVKTEYVTHHMAAPAAAGR